MQPFYIIFIFFFITNSIVSNQLPSKIIGLIAARNESLQISQCIKALHPYVDDIIYLDDASTDNSVAIVKSLANEYNILHIIEKKIWIRDEPGDRNMLLNIGRTLGGTHFIVIDADEMFTANCLEDNFLRNKILSLQPGDELLLNWIQLWRSIEYYRFDNSVWTWNYKNIIFCDDKKCSYSSDFIHTPRCPYDLHGTRYTIEGYTYGLLHFQFVNWHNLLIKQAWYRCLELIRNPNISAHAINSKYAPSKDERNLRREKCPKQWFDGYSSFFDQTIYLENEKWRTKQVIDWFTQYGKIFFKDLDIWDINWNI